MKVIKFFLSVVGAIILLLLILVATMVTTMDKTPYKDMPYYADWKASIARVEPDSTQKPDDHGASAYVIDRSMKGHQITHFNRLQKIDRIDRNSNTIIPSMP